MQLKQGVLASVMICDELGCGFREKAEVALPDGDAVAFQERLMTDPGSVFQTIYAVFTGRGWACGTREDGEPHAVCPKCRTTTLN